MTGAGAASLSGRRVAIVVDHPMRDLAGLVLVASELCGRGVVCHLVPLNRQDAEIWALRPDFVLLNFLRRGANEDFARRLHRAGIPFGLLDTEGGVWPSEASYAEILWEDRELLRAARCACMWGPAARRIPGGDRLARCPAGARHGLRRASTSTTHAGAASSEAKTEKTGARGFSSTPTTTRSTAVS